MSGTLRANRGQHISTATLTLNSVHMQSSDVRTFTNKFENHHVHTTATEDVERPLPGRKVVGISDVQENNIQNFRVLGL